MKRNPTTIRIFKAFVVFLIFVGLLILVALLEGIVSTQALAAVHREVSTTTHTNSTPQDGSSTHPYVLDPDTRGQCTDPYRNWQIQEYVAGKLAMIFGGGCVSPAVDLIKPGDDVLYSKDVDTLMELRCISIDHAHKRLAANFLRYVNPPTHAQ